MSRSALSLFFSIRALVQFVVYLVINALRNGDHVSIILGGKTTQFFSLSEKRKNPPTPEGEKAVDCALSILLIKAHRSGLQT